MTTSYDVEPAGSGNAMPGYDAEGYQTWNPAVGIYHKPAAVKRESYGGIIGALQDKQVNSGATTKAYPENFAGIIAAIQDLTALEDQPGSNVGDKPPGGIINLDPDGNPIWIITEEPEDGELWFDTRQGRMFVWIEDDWYQTNGGDGIPIVTETAAAPEVETVVPGQFWWDASNNDLYIFDGLYQLPDGSFTTNGNVGGRPVWKLITDGLADAFQTTRTLPLGALGPRLEREGAPGLQFNYITEPEPTEMSVQSDYNVWLFDALKELDQSVFDRSFVTVGDTLPVDPRPGDFWYDTESLELSIWYDDGNSQQWVPTSTAYSYDDDLATLTAKIETEQRLREAAVTDVYSRIESLRLGGIPDVDALEAKVSALEDHVNNHPQEVDLTPYITSAAVATSVNDLAREINEVKNDIPSLDAHATKLELSSLASIVAQLPTTVDVASSILTAQPDLSSYVTQQHIDNSISNITTEYLPRTGGTLSGSFVVEKEDMAFPAFDFSSEKWYSYSTHKYATNGTGNHYSTFGTTDKPWEYAWDFSSNEDFCWVYNDTNKVFSITKEGPACSTLYLGDFSANSNNTGRVLRNKIDVKDRLTKYQFAFETMRQGVATATDFDSLKANIVSALASV